MESPQVAKPELKDFAPFALPTPAWYRPAGYLLAVASWLSLAIGLCLMCVFIVVVMKVGITGAWAAQVTGTLTLGLFTFLRDMSERLRVNARVKLLTERRAPLLYLRPFFHEQPRLLYEQNKDLFSYRSDNSARGFSESLDRTAKYAMPPVLAADGPIAEALQNVGPLIAIGVPQETFPPPGAIRLYFRDDQWQEMAAALMSISRLVIFQAGYTSGVEWEMNAIRQHFGPEQIYFSFLGWRGLKRQERQAEYELFRMQTRRIYGVMLPEQYAEADFIFFDQDWRPHGAGIGGEMRLIMFVRSSLRRLARLRDTPPPAAVRDALGPVLRSRGIKVGEWRNKVYLAVTYSAYLVALGGAAYLLIKFFGT